MPLLNRDQILTADDMRKEEVQVPEWGGSVFVRNMLGFERDAFEAAQIGKKEPLKNFRARTVAATVCDEQGTLLFTKDDVEALGKKSSTALNRVFEVAARLAAVDQKSVEELGNA